MYSFILTSLEFFHPAFKTYSLPFWWGRGSANGPKPSLKRTSKFCLWVVCVWGLLPASFCWNSYHHVAWIVGTCSFYFYLTEVPYDHIFVGDFVCSLFLDDSLSSRRTEAPFYFPVHPSAYHIVLLSEWLKEPRCVNYYRIGSLRSTGIRKYITLSFNSFEGFFIEIGFIGISLIH